MKIGNGSIANIGAFGINSTHTDGVSSYVTDSGFENYLTDGDSSALRARNINSSIGLLQSAIIALDNAIGASVDVQDTVDRVSRASFFGRPIFSVGSTISDDTGNIMFDFGKVLDVIVGSDDINILKRYLRQENDLLKNYLSMLRDAFIDVDEAGLDSDFLMSNSSLFSKSHDLSNLSSKIDSLLA